MERCGHGMYEEGEVGDGTFGSPVQVRFAWGNRYSRWVLPQPALKIGRNGVGMGCKPCGELGDGTTIAKRSPVQVQGLSGVTAVAAGNEYKFSLEADGTYGLGM